MSPNKTDCPMPQPASFAELREKLLGNSPAARNPRVLIVAFGDSVTLGLTVNPELLHERAYHALLRVELAREFPTASFSAINAGVSGDSAQRARRRLQRDALDAHADLVIIAFGLNDSSAGKDGLSSFAEELGNLVRQAQDSGAAVILMTPNAMATRDNGHVDPKFRGALPDVITCQNEGLLALYAEQVRQAGAAAGAPVADVYAEWERRSALGEDMTAHLANGLNHPDAYGHRIACDLLLKTLLSALHHTPAKLEG